MAVKMLLCWPYSYSNRLVYGSNNGIDWSKTALAVFYPNITWLIPAL